MWKSRIAVAAITTVVVGVALVGCSSSAGSSSTSLTVEDYYSAPQSSVMDGIYQACGAQNGVTVTSTHVPAAGLIAKVLQQSSSKTLPDVLMLDNPEVQQIAASGALSPLADYGITGEGFAPGVVSAGTYNGKLYGLAPGVNSIALFYNTDLFTAAGLTPPTTWDELKADATKLTSGDQYGFAFSGINTFEGTWQFLPFMWTNGGDEKDIATPQTAQALQLLVDMVDNGSASKSVVNWSQNDVLDQFTAGKTAMMVNGPWQFPALAKFTNLHWASVPIPGKLATDKPVAPLGGETFNVPNTGNKDTMATAGKIVACINSDENQATIAKSAGLIPSTLTVATKAVAENPLLASFATTVATARARTGELGADWPAAATRIYTAEQLALTGKATPTDALAQAQNQ
ncbi:sugar ABC transporter substrate-binding protein [Subtercola frigoramans]|uniref:Multiple sugar transport system substrate-binding protein n=1 Tax=Subtercola frigoramans TaxID=120298 RepID=A0ABS2L286_9MICO|nr:sugar ABC transporter substrate-binding protein [Subtercola frigoramans]MBM7471203.1 multiple sugar transport system substrate-binding protein [Subtercola frigoramans]